ncbi:MAG: prolipoprotein diacylglyceryl transferase [Bacteroidota bacterium]
MPAYIIWNINPEIFNVFGIAVRYYGLLFVGGLLICNFIIRWIYQREKIPLEKFDSLIVYGVVGIFAGARLGHCLFYEPGYFLQHPLEIILPIQPIPGGGYKFAGYQGLASHGGTLGLAIALVLYSRKTKISLLKVIDIVAIVAPLGACFIRMANLMNSEIIGIPSSVPWAFIFVKEDNIPRHPAQLYEAIAYFFSFLILITLYKNRNVKLQTGILFGISIALIFTARFFIEFIKEKQVPFEEQMKLDMGQLLSIPFILIAIGYIIYGLRKQRKSV